MECGNCHHLIEDPEALFCARCGLSLCREGLCCFCGKPFQPDARFCDRCGMPVDTTPPPPRPLSVMTPPLVDIRTVSKAATLGPFKALYESRLQSVQTQPDDGRQTPGKARFGIREDDWIAIEGGSYLMGSPEGERDRFDNERQHEVKVAPFEILKTPVTFDMFDLFCHDMKHVRAEDEGWGRGNRPVINLTYWSAMEYCFWLSERTADTIRLATEAEWEYACRAGTTSPFWTGATITTDQANFDGNFTYGGSELGVKRGKTTPVDSFPPNPWGLHDMHGNVWEWCASVFDELYQGLEQKNAGYDQTDLRDRVVRGGSWYNVPSGIRSASRNKLSPNLHYLRVGFRIVRELD